MRIILTLAAVAALTACSEPAPEPAPAETAEAPPPPMVAEGAAPGTYDVTDVNGGTGTTTINADGTYVDVNAEGTETRGTYMRRDGQDCFDPEGEAAEMCWTMTPPAADGTFTATSADGTTVTVKPQAAVSPAAAPTAPAPME
jgi:ABC-type oligopeptide transport system substrate-binding subunit